jgi:hypothetical protein
MTQEEKQYVFGDWKRDGKCCPIESAGLTDLIHTVAVAEDFDDDVRFRIDADSTEGTVDKETAQEIFEQLEERYERRMREEPQLEQYYEKKLEVARRVNNEEFK